MHKGDSIFSFVAGIVPSVFIQEQFNPHDIKELSLFIIRAAVSGFISFGVAWCIHRVTKK